MVNGSSRSQLEETGGSGRVRPHMGYRQLRILDSLTTLNIPIDWFRDYEYHIVFLTDSSLLSVRAKRMIKLIKKVIYDDQHKCQLPLIEN